MTEEFALEQLARDRRAVDLDQWSFPPFALPMDRPGDQLLAGSGFAQDQHARLRRSEQRDLLEQFADRRAPADYRIAARRSLHFVAQQAVFRLQTSPQTFDFFERPGIGNRDRGVVGKGSQPGEIRHPQPLLTKDGQHAQILPETQADVRQSWQFPRTAPNLIEDPFAVRGYVLQQNGLSGSADPADLAHAQWNAPQRTIEPAPADCGFFAQRCSGIAARCRQRDRSPQFAAAATAGGDGFGQQPNPPRATPEMPDTSTTIRRRTASSVRS